MRWPSNTIARRNRSVGAVISLADRFDSLSGLFAVGLAPTGSADPWALRRAALGIVETLIKHQVSFSLRAALEAAAKLQPVAVEAKALDDAHAFLVGRERAALLDQGLRYDLVDAVLAARGDDPFVAKQSIEALAAEAAKPDWSITLDNYARCVRIVRDLKETLPLDIAKDSDPHTQALYQAYDAAQKAIGPQSSIGAFFERAGSAHPGDSDLLRQGAGHARRSVDPADAAGAAAAHLASGRWDCRSEQG